MNILLTGGNGFIGTHLVRDLNNCGHKVFLSKSNISNYESLQKEIENLNFDTVIHLAGLSHVVDHSPSLLYETNVIGSQNVVHAVEKNHQKKKIFLASTCHVYADTKSPISETFPLGPKSHYAASKLSMEFICNNTAMRNKIVSLRLFNCIGIGQKESFFIPKILKAHIQKEPVIHLGRVETKREFNDVRWAVKVIRSLAEVDAPPGNYNICSGKAFKASEVLSLVSEKTKHFPEIISDVELLRPGEQSVIVGDPTRTLSTLRQNGIRLHQPPIRKILDDMITEYKRQINAKKKL